MHTHDMRGGLHRIRINIMCPSEQNIEGVLMKLTSCHPEWAVCGSTVNCPQSSKKTLQGGGSVCIDRDVSSAATAPRQSNRAAFQPAAHARDLGGVLAEGTHPVFVIVCACAGNAVRKG